ncbi:MAG: PKD domain-containing protein, partial [Candidatus Hodarchaeota archaeon]
TEKQAPSPPAIVGETNGKPGTLYPYTFTSIDPDGDQVSYYIEWGDGDITDWTAFQASGPPGYSRSHAWDEQGRYTIEAKAKDIHGAVSDWAELTVTMPRNRIVNRPFQWFLQQHPYLFPILQKILLFQR